jgi:hypothetical protein
LLPIEFETPFFFVILNDAIKGDDFFDDDPPSFRKVKEGEKGLMNHGIVFLNDTSKET